MPQLIRYQGKLEDTSGNPVTNEITVTFTFWNQMENGTQLGSGFSDADTLTPDADGLYSTFIGDDPADLVPESVFDGDTVWLNVNVEGEDLVPRKRVGAVGYAFRSSRSDSLAGDLTAEGDRIDLTDTAWIEIAPGGKIRLRNRYVVDGWTLPVDVDADSICPPNTSGNYPQVAMATNGDTVVVWEQRDTWNKRQVFISEYDGTWHHPADIEDNISPDGQECQGFPQLAMADNGDAIVAWAQSDGLKYRIYLSERRSGVWDHPFDLSDSVSPAAFIAYDPKIAMGTNGDAVCSWDSFTGTTPQYAVFRSHKHGAWAHPGSIGDRICITADAESNPHVAIDDSGNAIVTWKEWTGATHAIFKSEYRGSGWTDPVSTNDSISPHAGFALEPVVAMDNNGNAIIAWKQTMDTGYKGVFKSEYRSGFWSHPANNSQSLSLSDGTVQAEDIQIAMSDNGDAIIVWVNNDVQFAGYQQIYKAEYRGGIWTPPAGLSDNVSPDGQSATKPRVAMDNNGDVVIVWQQSDGVRQRVFKSECNSGVWTHPSGLSDSISPPGYAVQLPDVAMGLNGEAVIVWLQQTASPSGTYGIYIAERR